MSGAGHTRLKGRELLARELRANLPGPRGVALAGYALAGEYHCGEGRATTALLDALARERGTGADRLRDRALAGAYDEPPSRQAAVERVKATAKPLG